MRTIYSRSREYNTIHQWVLRHYNKTGTCEQCKRAKRTEWSNRSGRYIKNYRSDWQELCISCHNEYDIKHFNKNRPYGRPPKQTQTYIDALARLRTYAWYVE